MEFLGCKRGCWLGRMVQEWFCSGRGLNVPYVRLLQPPRGSAVWNLTSVISRRVSLRRNVTGSKNLFPPRATTKHKQYFCFCREEALADVWVSACCSSWIVSAPHRGQTTAVFSRGGGDWDQNRKSPTANCPPLHQISWRKRACLHRGLRLVFTARAHFSFTASRTPLTFIWLRLNSWAFGCVRGRQFWRTPKVRTGQGDGEFTVYKRSDDMQRRSEEENRAPRRAQKQNVRTNMLHAGKSPSAQENAHNK